MILPFGSHSLPKEARPVFIHHRMLRVVQ
jgi:hypothetical protein